MTSLRHGGIIAAGEGSRMASRYPGMPKPLVRVGGKPLIGWVALALRAAGIRRLLVLLNSRGGAVRDYLRSSAGRVPGLEVSFLRRDTDSSWESFRLLSRTLARRSSRFLLSAADTVVSPADAARFAKEAFRPLRGAPPAAALGLTRFVDDEKPLWAQLGPGGLVTALGPGARRGEAVTCGLYALSAKTAARMPPERAYGRLRDFWTSLVRSGEAVRGVLLADAVDVDRPEDVAVAERKLGCSAA
ncbi:MAG: NDP-sugar synthase [Elusimicrobia bacterium]|nr:NDP-sugar synthase [Elusimicrobiota bacterium]